MKTKVQVLADDDSVLWQVESPLPHGCTVCFSNQGGIQDGGDMVLMGLELRVDTLVTFECHEEE